MRSGAFSKALKTEGFMATGEEEEYDEDPTDHAAKSASCETFSRRRFFTTQKSYVQRDPSRRRARASPGAGCCATSVDFLYKTGRTIVRGIFVGEKSKPGVGGAILQGDRMKRQVRRGFLGSASPTPLLRIERGRPSACFTWVESSPERVHWEVLIGSPYAGGGVFKRLATNAAALVGSKRILGANFGNWFRGVPSVRFYRDARP
jgi:hypothetical protein